MAQRNQLESYLHALLEVDRIKDYGPNGLQVEGRGEHVRRLMVHGINPFAQHLPLDARFGEQDLGFSAAAADARTVSALAARLGLEHRFIEIHNPA